MRKETDIRREVSIALGIWKTPEKASKALKKQREVLKINSDSWRLQLSYLDDVIDRLDEMTELNGRIL